MRQNSKFFQKPVDPLLPIYFSLAYFNLSPHFASKRLNFSLAYMQRLLQEVKKDRELAQAVVGEGPPPILYLNCRKKDISSPQQFANAIRELVTKDTAFGKWWKAVKLKFPYIQVDLGTLFGPADDRAPMESIINSLTTFLEATRPLPYKPVIIIDEANVIMKWSDDPDRKQLEALLRFFVATTKEDHLGHFVLASSESFVVDFLEKGKPRKSLLAMCIVGTYLLVYLFAFFPRRRSFTSCFLFFQTSICLTEGLHTKQYSTEEIGDLATIDEAKQFVESLMLCDRAPSSFFDTTDDGEQIDMWPRVYEICGGNIGLLERCAEYANDIGSWEKGLKWVSKDLEGAVKRGLWPKGFSKTGGSRSPPAWTKEDYKTVLREIALAKKHKHAVSFDKLRVAPGEDALLSMVEWNLLSVRRKSEWAKDLPETVFTDLDDDKVVMMPSPAELYFVLKMHKTGKLEE